MEHISALMDGELFDDETDGLLDGIKRDSDAREKWFTYHLISDALRQFGRLHTDIVPNLHERLQAEPTVLAPRGVSGHKARWFALSAAASVMALTLVAWLSAQVGTETVPQMAAAQQFSAIQTASFQGGSMPNSYLMAHQEFSPSTNVQGAASYMRAVAGQ